MIDWENKPEWADVWIEAIDPSEREWGGWHKSEDGNWVDVDGNYWEKVDECYYFAVHYPPTKQEEEIMNKDQAIKQLQALQAEMDKLKVIIKKPEKWQPSGGRWFVNGFGLVVSNYVSSTSASSFGTEFGTEEEALEAAYDYREYHRLYKWVKDNDDGWVADWDNEGQTKYSVAYYNCSKEWRIVHRYVVRDAGVVYMSQTNAKKLIAALNSGEVML